MNIKKELTNEESYYVVNGERVEIGGGTAGEKRKNITQKIDNLRFLGKDGDLIREDKLNLELSRDPIYLSQEMNRELVDINIQTNELVKFTKKTFYLLLFMLFLLIMVILK